VVLLIYLITLDKIGRFFELRFSKILRVIYHTFKMMRLITHELSSQKVKNHLEKYEI